MTTTPHLRSGDPTARSRPLSRPASTPISPIGSYTADRMAQSSPSSSISTANTSSKRDLVVHHFYIKTVGVLVESRLTYYGAKPEKKDKWFNLILPESDIHKEDLKIYQSISSFAPRPGNLGGGEDRCSVPPLLVAFVLDTSDLPSGQALLWNRDGVKIPIDMGVVGSKKGKEKEQRAGIILERWTLQATLPDEGPSRASLPPHTVYRLGIAHFRSLFSLVRLLPAYRLFRRLRRANNGLRLGIKLWTPEDFPNSQEGLASAWEVMERGVISLDTGLEQLVQESVDPQEKQHHNLPPISMFGVNIHLGVEYRPEVDFHVEDMETVLSEKFVDMDEDWFTPTMARYRMKESKSPLSVDKGPVRRVSGPTAIPGTSPIPPRQQAATPGSFKSSSLRPTDQRSVSGPGSAGKWGLLTGGLPFAGPPSGRETPKKEQTSPNTALPSGASITARRLSGHSIHPFNLSSSPSTSLLHSTSPMQTSQLPSSQIPQRPTLSSSKPSSVGRTSSFLSQSGRSFTHAQLANMQIGSASPPIGMLSGHQLANSPPIPPGTPVSPSSLSFSKQPIPRSISGRPAFVPSASSPFIPGSFDNTSTLGTSPGAPHLVKRYSSSLSQRPQRLGVSAASPGSGEGSSPGSLGPGQLRRTSTRTSQESGLRHSIEKREPGPDDDDIQAFLKTLDALPQPPSVAAQAAHASRSHLPSTSSSLSTPSNTASPAPLQASSSSPGGPKDTRTPITKAQVDDQLRRMAGSFNIHASRLMGDTPSASGLTSPISRATPSASTSSNTPSVGLLTASRPSPAPRPVSTESDNRPTFRRQTSNQRSSSAKPGSPLAGEPRNAEPARMPLPVQLGAARSLPGKASAPLSEDAPMPLLSAAGLPIPSGGGNAGMLSPQTTGGVNDQPGRSSRRGPVLLRGGFDQRGSSPLQNKTSVSSSPSHSPIRDFGRLGLRDREGRTGLGIGEKQAEEELDNWNNPRNNRRSLGPPTAGGVGGYVMSNTVSGNGVSGVPALGGRRIYKTFDEPPVSVTSEEEGKYLQRGRTGRSHSTDETS